MIKLDKGFFLILTAYLSWGLFPLFFKLLDHVPALEILLHRIIWAVPFTFIVLLFLGRTADILPTLKSVPKMRMILLTAVLISINWGVYVYSIVTDQALQASLGYFICPLVTVVIGVFILKEKISLQQSLALLIAVIAVFIQAIDVGAFPWIALVLAFSFAAYGLIKKTIDVGPTQSFFIEAFILSPVCIIVFLWLEAQLQSSFSLSIGNAFLLLVAGPITALPLIFFAAGARRISLNATGVMMYIVPTMVFIIAVFIFSEPITSLKMLSFAMIWVSLALYSFPINRFKKVI